MTEMTEAESGKSAVASDRWLITEARNVRWLLLTVVALSAGIGLLVVSQARVLSEACQRVVMQGQAVSSVVALALVLLLVAFCRSFLSYVLEVNAAVAAARIKQSVRSRLYRRLQILGPAGTAGCENGSLTEIVTKGVDELEPYFTRFLPQLILAALLPLMFLIVVLPSEWRSGLVLLISAPFIPLFMILIGKGSESIHRRQWGRLSLMAGYLLDRIQGLPDLIIFGAAKKEADTVARVSEEYRSATMAVLRLAFLSAFALEFFATVGTAVVAVIIGFRLLWGVLTLQEGLFVLLMAPEFYLPLRNLGLSYHARLQGAAVAAQIVPLLARPLPEGYGGSVQLDHDPPAIRFENVTFQYGSDRGGVAEVDLELPAGSVTALAGASGAGKSTLARLVIGLVRPERGRVLVNGLDLRDVSPESWRSQLAWVAQTPYFTAGTIRDNLLLGRPDAGEAEISSALEAAVADGFIRKLPHGLETVLGDRGAGLSGGELKRLALARAYICRATMIVLDEPTAGLDPDNELLVCHALAGISRGRTVLVISHRELTVQHVDRVAELVDGRVERVVAPSEFLGQGGGAP